MNAASILTADDYTPVTTSALNKNVLPPADVTSSAVGVSTSNSNEFQVVLVLTPQGVSKASSSSALSDVSKAGVKLSLNGGIMTLTGTESEFNKLGLEG